MLTAATYADREALPSNYPKMAEPCDLEGGIYDDGVTYPLLTSRNHHFPKIITPKKRMNMARKVMIFVMISLLSVIVKREADTLTKKVVSLLAARAVREYAASGKSQPSTLRHVVEDMSDTSTGNREITKETLFETAKELTKTIASSLSEIPHTLLRALFNFMPHVPDEAEKSISYDLLDRMSEEEVRSVVEKEGLSQNFVVERDENNRVVILPVGKKSKKFKLRGSRESEIGYSATHKMTEFLSSVLRKKHRSTYGSTQLLL